MEERGTRSTKILSGLTDALGSAPAVVAAICAIIVWLIGGLFVTQQHWLNDTYQLVINTATSVVTFMMVFVVQNTQNRDSKAIHAKLDAVLTNQKHVARGLNAVAGQVFDGDPPDEACLVISDELMGLEEAPVKEIRSEHDKVRDA